MRMAIAAVALICMMPSCAQSAEIAKNVDILEALAKAEMGIVGEKPRPERETVEFQSCMAAAADLASAECYVYFRGELIRSVAVYYSQKDENDRMVDVLPADDKIALIRSCYDREVRDRCWVKITGTANRTFDPKDDVGSYFIVASHVEFEKR